VLGRLPILTARAYERVCLAALVLVFAIILTGAAVRLTGSGLGCPNWPKCGGGYVAPLELHAWIEFGNRLITGLVGLPCLATFVLAYRRRPYRRDLRRLSTLLPLGVLAQAVLGGFTVMYDLKPGFVMSHFLLSQAILAVAVALWWRARHEPDTRPRSDRRLVWATRALLPVGALVLFAGTLTTAAGPHPGSRATGEIVPRFTGFGVDTLDTMYHWHGRAGTLLGLLAVATWFLARRLRAGRGVQRSLTVLCVTLAAQGVVGLVQYQLQLPAGLVWVHVALACTAWLALCLAVVTAGRLHPVARRELEPDPGPRTPDQPRAVQPA
jgi:cytochrome c oxidase assembly protein subunit 15